MQKHTKLTGWITDSILRSALFPGNLKSSLTVFILDFIAFQLLAQIKESVLSNKIII